MHKCWVVLWIFKETSIPVLYVFQNQRTVNLGSSNILESKNSQFWFFEKNSESKNVSSNCLENLKELMVFMKELSNNWHSLASSFKKIENYSHIPKPAIWQFWKLAGKWICTRVGNRWICVPHSKHHLPLVGLPFMHGGWIFTEVWSNSHLCKV